MGGDRMPRHDPDQRTKQDILEAAMRLFSERGLENVNIEDVVKEVGVTRGAFYHYFKSREELIAGVMYKSFECDNTYLLADQQEGLNALEKLHFVIKQNLRPRLEISDGMRKQMRKLGSNPVVFKNEIMFQVNVMSAYIEKLLMEGNQDGSIHVAFPKQVSQIALLIVAWISPYTFEVSYQEYVDKILFFEQLTNSLGVPLIDEEIKQLYLEFGKLECRE